MSFEISHLSKTFREKKGPDVKALDDFSLRISDSERLLVVVGPSGSGKTTLLRLIAGLEDEDSGSITLNGKDMTGLAVQSRDLAMVFQEPALYPHLTVYENVISGLSHYGLSAAEKEKKAKGMLSRLSLVPYLNFKPRHLSEGTKQKTSIAKAMVREPSLLLLDEPLSHVDEAAARRIEADLISLNERSGALFIYVTHDLHRAFRLGGTLLYMSRGKAVQKGKFADLVSHPVNEEVRSFFRDFR